MRNRAQFACGEFIPGKRVITTPPIAPIVPPKYIPVPPKISDAPLPILPVPPEPPPTSPPIAVPPALPEPPGNIPPISIPISDTEPPPSIPPGRVPPIRIEDSGGTVFVGVDSALVEDLNSSGVYNKIVNIFNIPQRTNTVFVDNYRYLTIFKTSVAREVNYLFNAVGSIGPWKEAPFTQLSIQRVLDSLRPDVLETFDRVILPGGKTLGRISGADIIRKLLLEGRISEFNIDFYKTLINQQYEQQKVVVQSSNNQELRERAALGYIVQTSKSMDPNNFSEREKIETARMKALLTDIESTISIDYVETSTVPLEDPGLALFSGIELLDYVDVGIGDGYYFSVEVLGQEAPVLINNVLSSTYYINIYDKQIAFDILGDPLFTKFIVSSDLSSSELGNNYNDNFSTSSLYFKLNLSSIVDLDKTSNFVDIIKASYMLVEDLDEAREHSHTYGAMSVSLNLDYRDPFIQYASNSGEIDLITKDITFRAFKPSRGPGYSNLIRQIPHAVILTPCSSTEDNPFFGHSVIDDFRNVLIRSINVMPYFPIKNEKKALNSKLLYDVSSTYRLGLVGVNDTQNFVYEFTPSSHSTVYTTNEININRRIYNNIIKNRLEASYNFNSLAWWEIFRRLTAKEFGCFITQFNRNLFNSLSNGSEGYRIRHVLNREGNTLDLDGQELTEEDIVYLTEQDRQNLLVY